METTLQDMLNSFNSISAHISQMLYVSLDSSWHLETPYTAPESRIYYITEGEADITCNGTPYHLSPGNIYFLPAGAAYTYCCRDRVEKLYIHVSMLQRNGYDLFNQVKECVVLAHREQEIHRLCQCVAQADLQSMLYLKAHLHALMLEVAELTGVDLGKPEVYSPLTWRAMEYIEENLHCGLTVEQVIKGLQVSQYKLLKTFRKDMNVTVGKYIADRLMYAVENRLRIGEESIRHISERFGFCDQFYFSRRFSNYFGVSPKQYRKQIMMSRPASAD